MAMTRSPSDWLTARPHEKATLDKGKNLQCQFEQWSAAIPWQFNANLHSAFRKWWPRKAGKVSAHCLELSCLCLRQLLIRLWIKQEQGEPNSFKVIGTDCSLVSADTDAAFSIYSVSCSSLQQTSFQDLLNNALHTSPGEALNRCEHAVIFNACWNYK